MNKILLTLLIICVSSTAYADGRTVSPASPANAYADYADAITLAAAEDYTDAEIAAATANMVETGDDAVLGDITVDSVQGDAITVGRIPDDVIQVGIPIAITADDTMLAGGVTFNNSTTLASVGNRSSTSRDSTYRFTTLGIPQGATIVSAQLKLEALIIGSVNEIKWTVGLVDSIAAVSPTDAESWPATETLIGTPDTGSSTGVTVGEKVYFPTASTGTNFVTSLQSLVDNPSWGASSAVMVVLSDDSTIANRYFNVWHHNASSAQFPTLIVTYTESMEYSAVATTAEAQTIVSEITLPDTLYAASGDRLELFIRGMIEAQDPYALPVTMEISGLGHAYPRYFELTPETTDAGTEDFTLEVLDGYGETLLTKTVDMVITDLTTPSVTTNINVGIVGDSLTEAGVWAAELNRRLTGTGGTPAGLEIAANITFVGDKVDVANTTAYTGWSGWTFNSYNSTTGMAAYLVTAATHDKDREDTGSIWHQSCSIDDDCLGESNTCSDSVCSDNWYLEYADTGVVKVHGAEGHTLPASGTLVYSSGYGVHQDNIVYTALSDEEGGPFWAPATDEVDFTCWETRNVTTGNLDAMYILLGWNSTSDDLATYLESVRLFLDRLHRSEANGGIPGCVVRLIGLQGPSISGAGTPNLSSSSLGQYYDVLQDANDINKAYQALANEDAYSSWVEYIGTSAQFDAENNYPTSDVAVNSRNTDTEKIGTNGRHPDTEGYNQIADAVFREIVSWILD